MSRVSSFSFLFLFFLLTQLSCLHVGKINKIFNERVDGVDWVELKWKKKLTNENVGRRKTLEHDLKCQKYPAIWGTIKLLCVTPKIWSRHGEFSECEFEFLREIPMTLECIWNLIQPQKCLCNILPTHSILIPIFMNVTSNKLIDNWSRMIC